jgi:Exo-beta-D-glucosaminidase Ig-fold domain
MFNWEPAEASARYSRSKVRTEIIERYRLVFWEENSISLLPEEKREVTVHLRKTDLAAAQPTLVVDGFNVLAAKAHEAEK